MCLNSACDGKIISDAIFFSPSTIVILASALLLLPLFSLLPLKSKPLGNRFSVNQRFYERLVCSFDALDWLKFFQVGRLALKICSSIDHHLYFQLIKLKQFCRFLKLMFVLRQQFYNEYLSTEWHPFWRKVISGFLLKLQWNFWIMPSISKYKKVKNKNFFLHDNCP